MKILSLTSVYPSQFAPELGLFVKRRLRALSALTPVQVVNPVPWYWRLAPGQYAGEKSFRDELTVDRPTFFYPPRFPKQWDPKCYAASVSGTLRRIRREFPFDLIDAHFGWPDGVAAVKLGRKFEVPVFITLRGKEAGLAETSWTRRQMAKALSAAAGVLCNSRPLAALAGELGVEDEKMIVVPNGVDTEQFFPMDRQAVRKQLALAPEARYLVTVAHLRRTKGFLDVLDALPAIRKKCGDVRWLIVGGSTRMYHFEPELRREIRRRELDDVVRLVGPQPPQQVNVYLNAADLFVLATHGEGWCNVLMESLATGLPVVTTAVGGNPEIVRDENLGLLVPPRDSEALASAVVAALVRTWNRKGLVDYAKELTWDATARKVITFFELRAEKGGTGWL